MAFLDIVNTVTQKEIISGVIDNVFRNSPLLATFRKGSSLRSYDGGPSWQENFLYDVLPVVGYKPGETFDLSTRQVATGTTVLPRYYNVPVSALIEKIKIEMNGPRAVFDYVDMLLQVAALSMSGKLANDAYRHGQSLSGSVRDALINGLDEALNDGSTNGFDGRTYASYLTLTRNAEIGAALNSPMTGPAASVSGAISYPILEQAFQSVSVGPEKPNLLLTTNLGLAYVKMAFQAQQRFEGTSDPNLGFQSVKFNGADVVADNYAPGTRTATAQDTLLGYSAVAAGETLWFLNTKYFRFYVSTDSLFGFGFTGFMPQPGNSTVAGHYKFAGNLTCVAPRYSRVLYAITG